MPFICQGIFISKSILPRQEQEHAQSARGFAVRTHTYRGWESCACLQKFLGLVAAVDENDALWRSS